MFVEKDFASKNGKKIRGSVHKHSEEVWQKGQFCLLKTPAILRNPKGVCVSQKRYCSSYSQKERVN